LFGLEEGVDILELMAWANRVRERHHGRQVHLCSIINIKSGGCPEDCKFCAQSAFVETGAARYDLIGSEPILRAVDEAAANGVGALGLVAAWKELNEGPALDAVCRSVGEVARTGRVRPDVSLGMIRSQGVADRLREAGVVCYNHNLETSHRFFPHLCTTHRFEDRVQTIGHLKRAGIQVCSGGIIGMGETREDRCDLAWALRELEPDYVPINCLNPIPGTPLVGVPPLAPLEILKTIACFRLLLPHAQILVAGGREVNLRDLQGLLFLAGASALMVGNYLTTLNQPVAKDLQMLKDLGLVPVPYAGPEVAPQAPPAES
jgi:biotin synthase